MYCVGVLTFYGAFKGFVPHESVAPNRLKTSSQLIGSRATARKQEHGVVRGNRLRMELTHHE